MNAWAFLDLCAGSILINNIVLSRCIGACPLCGAPERLPEALGMGLAATVVTSIASALAWAINVGILVPLGAQYLHTFVFVMVIVSLILLADMMLQKLNPGLYEWAGAHLPVLASNCVVIAASLIAVGTNPVTRGQMPLAAAVVNGCAIGVGYALALVFMVAIQERLTYAAMPRSLRGMPAAFLSLGLLSLAFMGFRGLHFFRG